MHTLLKVLVAQSCLILCDPMYCSLPVTSVHRILKARILEWIAMPSSSGLPDPGIKPESLALQKDPYCLHHQEAHALLGKHIFAQVMNRLEKPS